MSIDWTALIASIRDLITKARAKTATAADWINVIYLVAQALKQIAGGPIYRSASHAGELEHDPAFANSNEESSIIAAVYEIVEDLTGEPIPAMRGGDGRFIKIVLPLLLKYLLPLLLTSDKEIVTEVLSEVVNKLVS